MFDAVHDILDHNDVDGDDDSIDPNSESQSGQFDDLFSDLNTELWPGCTEYSSLSFVVTLMHFKVMNKWTNKLFDHLLKVLKKSHPIGNTIP